MTNDKKIPLFWATAEHDLVGNALGYNTHNRHMKKSSEPFFEYTHEAEIALTISPADKFRPVQGKFNVLFTMWELLDVPAAYIEGLSKADAVIVPSRFCKDLFSKYYPANRIYVCHEGVDENIFTYKERRFPMMLSRFECKKCAIGAQAVCRAVIKCKKCGEILEEVETGERFRFLWVGAPNPRKGYPFMIEMVRILEQIPTVEIYMKTTMPKMNWKKTIVNTWRRRKEIFRNEKGELHSLARMFQRIPKPYHNDKVICIGKNKNVFMDTRKLPVDDLVKLYHSAHAFVLPHLGEGWGLTLCEAMATGCPSVSVAETGCKDFFDAKVGYTLQTDIVDQDLSDNYKLDKARAYVPRANDVLDQMTRVMMEYPKALKKGQAASERIRKDFTWTKAGIRLGDVIRQIVKERNIDVWKTSTQSAATL